MAAIKLYAIPKARLKPKCLSIGMTDNVKAKNPIMVVIPEPNIENPTPGTECLIASC